MAGVLGNLPQRRLKRLADDVDAAGLVVVLALQAFESLGRVEQRNAAARNDAFLDRCAGRVESVVDAILALLHLDLGRAADLDHRNAAGELRQPLLQLLTVVVGRRVLDLLTDRADAAFDRFVRTGAVDDRRVVLVDRDALGLAEHARQ